MKIIKLINQIIYVIIIFYIVIFGISGISRLLASLKLIGSLNGLLTFIITTYAIGMFVYDINNVYTNEK